MKHLLTILSFLISLSGCSQQQGTNSTPNMKKVIVIAHRGASGYAPENTLASFKKGMEMGADYVELDVHLTKDDSVLVIHDESVDRTTNGKGKVRNLTFAETQKLDASNKFSATNAGEKLPSLNQVLDLVNGKCKIMIEIKRGDEFYPGIEQKILDIIKSHHAETWCEMHSFHDHVIENWLKIDTTIKVYKLLVGQIGFMYYDDGIKFGNVINKWKGKGLTGISPSVKFARKGFIEKIHKAGMKTFVWTVNEESDMKNLIQKGADGIITNYPDKVKR